MRRFILTALFVLTASFLAYALGSAVDSALIPGHNVQDCQWDKINKGDLPDLCWDQKRSVMIMDGGRYEWDTRTNKLTDYATR